MLTKIKLNEIRRKLNQRGDRLPVVFGALADPGRFRIFNMFIKYQNICVSEVAEILGVSVPAASQQLRILELSGLLSKERMGKMICYIINDDPLTQSIIKFLFKRSR